MRDTALTNAQRRSRQQDLEESIVQTTRDYTATPSLPIRRQLEEVKMELNALFTSQAEYALQQLKGWRLFTAQLRQREAALAMPAVWGSVGTTLTHPRR
ncbi:hypothetical protein NDU88_005407 [Pleurodeles waltl]|uniref:Outer membrane efflux protein n=1 Tax=Pleurodeles waltl TaxID=8319 RepID=A0AAV7TU91_PLEWA|nr:hypothetical protein NDU88_005407 [Pleurodeles waltl]